MTDLEKAVECCREKRCEECPLMTTICDDLRVNMVDLPEELVDLIVEALSEQRERTEQNEAESWI